MFRSRKINKKKNKKNPSEFKQIVREKWYIILNSKKTKKKSNPLSLFICMFIQGSRKMKLMFFWKAIQFMTLKTSNGSFLINLTQLHKLDLSKTSSKIEFIKVKKYRITYFLSQHAILTWIWRAKRHTGKPLASGLRTAWNKEKIYNFTYTLILLPWVSIRLISSNSILMK